MSVVEVICGDAVTQLMGENPQEQSSLYPTLSLSTLPAYYRTMLAAMVTGIKTVPPPSKRRPVSLEVSEIEKWISALAKKKKTISDVRGTNFT